VHDLVIIETGHIDELFKHEDLDKFTSCTCFFSVAR